MIITTDFSPATINDVPINRNYSVIINKEGCCEICPELVDVQWNIDTYINWEAGYAVNANLLSVDCSEDEININFNIIFTSAMGYIVPNSTSSFTLNVISDCFTSATCVFNIIGEECPSGPINITVSNLNDVDIIIDATNPPQLTFTNEQPSYNFGINHLVGNPCCANDDVNIINIEYTPVNFEPLITFTPDISTNPNINTIQQLNIAVSDWGLIPQDATINITMNYCGTNTGVILKPLNDLCIPMPCNPAPDWEFDLLGTDLSDYLIDVGATSGGTATNLIINDCPNQFDNQTPLFAFNILPVGTWDACCGTPIVQIDPINIGGTTTIFTVVAVDNAGTFDGYRVTASTAGILAGSITIPIKVFCNTGCTEFTTHDITLNPVPLTCACIDNTNNLITAPTITEVNTSTTIRITFIELYNIPVTFLYKIDKYNVNSDPVTFIDWVSVTVAPLETITRDIILNIPFGACRVMSKVICANGLESNERCIPFPNAPTNRIHNGILDIGYTQIIPTNMIDITMPNYGDYTFHSISIPRQTGAAFAQTTEDLAQATLTSTFTTNLDMSIAETANHFMLMSLSSSPRYLTQYGHCAQYNILNTSGKHMSVNSASAIQTLYTANYAALPFVSITGAYINIQTDTDIAGLQYRVLKVYQTNEYSINSFYMNNFPFIKFGYIKDNGEYYLYFNGGATLNPSLGWNIYYTFYSNTQTQSFSRHTGINTPPGNVIGTGSIVVAPFGALNFTSNVLGPFPTLVGNGIRSVAIICIPSVAGNTYYNGNNGYMLIANTGGILNF